VLVGIGLIGVYLGYSMLTSPWLKVERKKSAVVKSSAPQEQSQVFAEQAQIWFREDPWVQTAKARFRNGDNLLYFMKHSLDNNDRSISISPVAFLWHQEDGEIPITATARSAQLDSSSEFNFQQAKFGRIVSGFLSGDVRITGPDGLRIEGSTFQISEDAMKIWTSQPVKFAWGTHSGRAESGAEIELLSSEKSSKSGLMAVTDVQRIRLLGRIHCNLMFADEDSEREPVQLTVSAANGFDYFVPTKEATFSGFTDARETNLDNQVLIERPTATGSLDRLYCSQLRLQFHPRIKAGSTRTKPTRQLQLARIIAEGQPVEFHTYKNGQEQIYANMGTLKYHLEERMMELIDRVVAATGRRHLVEVHQGETRLTTGHMLIAMNEKNDVHTVECRGEGRIGPSSRFKKSEGPQKDVMGATWTNSMLLRRGDEQRITLNGGARVVQASTNDSGKLQADLSLSGDTIEMLFESIAAATSDSIESLEPQLKTPTTSLDMSTLQPRLLVATGRVDMVSQDLTGHAREKLTVKFQKTAGAASAEAAPADANPLKTVSQSQQKPADRLIGKTKFSSDTVEATVRLPDSSQPEFQDVWLKGGVEIIHKGSGKDPAANEERNFTANGNMLYAKGGFQGDTEISLFGDPATLVNSTRLIEGQRIDLSQLKAATKKSQREARVEGSGRIRFVVNTGLNGKPLAKPSPLDIYWGDHMSFSGRTAHFVGNIRAVMNNEMDHDVELTCAGLKVHFTEDVAVESSGKDDEFRLSEPTDSKSPVAGIEKIECESRVVVDIDMMEEGVVIAHHHAEFADLVFNQITGEFYATGPGSVESVQPDKGTRKLAVSNRTVAKSNTPAKTSEVAYYFIRADFIGEMSGNRDKQFIRLKQHIRGIFGPVSRLTDRLKIDGLSTDELPENTGALECENLSISVVPGPEANPNTSFSLVAESNSTGRNIGTRSPCRFESKLFAGLADKIQYDHSKQQFILRADEGRQATVSYYPDGGKRQVLNGPLFEYYSDRNYLKGQISGVQSSGDFSLD
jgi:lipopolysaccharide export system protein LptA